MKRTGIRSWTIVVAGSLFIGGMLTGCGGGGSSSSDSTAQSSTSSASSASSAVASAAASSAAGADSGAQASASGADAAQGAVVQGGPGTVTLSWQPPTQNSDGTPLTSLAGYNIYYGTASQSYSQSIKVSNPGLSTYVVDNLPAGTYYFAIAAVDSTGAQSSFSPEVAAAVN